MITLRVRQTVASSALMQNARPRRRGQASQPRSGAPKTQGLTVAIAVAASSKMPSIAKHAHNSIGATAPIGTSPTLRIYTSLTDVTFAENRASIRLDQESVHLALLEIAYSGLGGLLERRRPYFGAPGHMRR
jgi:hypothetical protein